MCRFIAAMAQAAWLRLHRGARNGYKPSSPIIMAEGSIPGD